jgi:Transposase DDE domain group 1
MWAQRAEVQGTPFPVARAAGRPLPGLVIDLDASIVICHSDKEQAAPTFKHTFGYHPMLAFCDNTGKFLAAELRRGNAGSNTAADHITVCDATTPAPIAGWPPTSATSPTPHRPPPPHNSNASLACSATPATPAPQPEHWTRRRSSGSAKRRAAGPPAAGRRSRAGCASSSGGSSRQSARRTAGDHTAARPRIKPGWKVDSAGQPCPQSRLSGAGWRCGYGCGGVRPGGTG